MLSFKRWINLMKAKMYWIIILIVATTIVLAQTNYNPIGSNNALPTPNYNPVTQNYQNYTITSPSFSSTINNTNIIVINITNNITTFVTSINNITNNITTYVNFTNNNYIENNFTNNITNVIENNVTTYVNFSNNFYSAWLTIINNVTTNVTVDNNITTYVNTTNMVFVENNFTNNITNNVYTNVNVTILPTNESYNISFNIYNITNNFTNTYNNYFNVPISISPYILTYTNSSNIGYNESKLNLTIMNMCLLNNINYYNLTLYNLNVTNEFTYRESYAILTSTQNQTVASINTAYNVTFNNVESTYNVNNGVNGKISVNESGIYKIDVSAEVYTQLTGKTINIWFSKNDVNIPRSNSQYLFKSGTANNIISVPIIIRLNTTDYFQVKYSSDDTQVRLQEYSGTTIIPNTPSVILTMMKIGD